MAGRGALVTDGALRARVEALEESLASARAELCRRTDELEAARQINRELTARLNLEGR